MTNPRRKLSADQVIGIRLLLNYTTVPHRLIAQRYGVSRSAITKIASGENWSQAIAELQKAARRA